MKKLKSKKGGFTLVESMVSLGIFGLMAAGSIASMPKVREVVVKSERVQIASNLMNNQMESLRILPFEQLEAMMADGAVISGSYEVSDVAFDVVCRLSSYEVDLYGDNAIQAEVSCEWSLNDQPYRETYWALFVRDGLSDKAFNG